MEFSCARPIHDLQGQFLAHLFSVSGPLCVVPGARQMEHPQKGPAQVGCPTDVGPVSYVPMALSYVLRPCPMSYGPVLYPIALALSYVLWPCPMSCGPVQCPMALSYVLSAHCPIGPCPMGRAHWAWPHGLGSVGTSQGATHGGLRVES